MNLWWFVRGLTCTLATLAPISVHAEDDRTAALPDATSQAQHEASRAEASAAGPVRSQESPARSTGHLTLRPFYRNDELRFSIDGGGIDILSELDWDDVRSAGLELEGRVRLPGPFELRGDVAYGRVYDGKLRDSDYDGSGKTLEFSRSRSDTDRGSTFDASISIGLPFAPGSRWIVVPLLGLCYGEQNYNLRNGVQLVPAFGPFGGLDSDYETRWFGVLWGAELHWLPTEEWDLMARFTSRHANYDADGHFNLRGDLEQPRSFAQTTAGQGSIFELQVKHELGAGFTLDLATRWDAWDTRSGRMEFFLASGGSSRQGLNEVKLDSFRASLGLGYSF